jgi:large subunit ribosomal protein L23
MNNLNLYEVLRAPHVTEKTTTCQGQGNYVIFKVAQWANKRQIKEAVEKLFNVSVEGVNTLNIKGKKKKFRRVMGKRNDWKKAFVRLSPKDKIDLFPNV